jgi:DNA-binding response OmpR family regulator
MTTDREKQIVLIVDDSPINLKILVEALGDDHDVVVATSGADALVAATQNRPDLCLLDIQMPGMNGYDLCRSLKADPALCEIPVIFVTALSRQENEIGGLALGAADYITKPFHPEIVRLRVNVHLELRRQRMLAAQRTAELESALASIRTLRQILPICMFCRKIRNDDGYWRQLEAYIGEQTGSEFSHGICPDCLASHYPDGEQPAETS